MKYIYLKIKDYKVEKFEHFENYAFISYSHHDKKWAKWLQKELESYSVPSIIRRKVKSLPKRIRPVFLDATDLSSGILQKNLNQELLSSKYLIVICSCEAKKSEWVNKEIEYFLELGRSDKIIPLIVDEIPDIKNPIQECFPQLLHTISGDILGIDIHEFGKSQALIKVVSTLLGIKFDYLWQRYKRTKRQRYALFLFSFLLIISSVIFYLYGFQLTSVSYYKGYVRKFGVMQGLYQIDKSQAEKMMSSYRFSSHGCFGKPFQIDIIDGAGNPSKINRFSAIVSNSNKEDSIWATTLKLKYDQNGNVLEELAVDYLGNVFLDFIYVNYNLAAYLEGGFVTQQSIKGASYVQFTRDKFGIEIGSKFFDQNKQPAKDNTGAFGIRFAYNPDFSEVIITSLDQKGNPVVNNYGFVSTRIINDTTGNQRRIEFIDYDNKLVKTIWGYVAIKNEYDENGNKIRTLFLDSQGQNITNIDGVKGLEFHCVNGILRKANYIK
jgi:hypothetical protein